MLLRASSTGSWITNTNSSNNSKNNNNVKNNGGKIVIIWLSTGQGEIFIEGLGFQGAMWITGLHGDIWIIGSQRVVWTTGFGVADLGAVL